MYKVTHYVLHFIYFLLLTLSGQNAVFPEVNQKVSYSYCIYNSSGKIGEITEFIQNNNRGLEITRTSNIAGKLYKIEGKINNNFKNLSLIYTSPRNKDHLFLTKNTLFINGKKYKRFSSNLIIPSTLVDIWIRYYNGKLPEVIDLYYEEKKEVIKTKINILSSEKIKKFLFDISNLNVEFVFNQKTNHLNISTPGIKIIQEPFDKNHVLVDMIPKKMPIEIPKGFPSLPEKVTYEISSPKQIDLSESRIQKIISTLKSGRLYTVEIRCSFNHSPLKLDTADRKKLELAKNILHGFISKIKRIEGSTNIVPEDVIKNKEADCQGISNTFVYLCRKKGIEARSVVGVVIDFKEKNYQFHQWVQLHLGNKWIDWDPTFGIEGISLGHILFFKKEKWLDYLKAISLAKNMKIKIRS